MKFNLSTVIAVSCLSFLSCSDHIVDIPEELNESNGKSVDKLGLGSKATLHDFKVYDPNEPVDSDMPYESNPEVSGGSPQEDYHIAGNLNAGSIYGNVRNEEVGFSFSFDYAKKPDGTYAEPNLIVNSQYTTFNTKRVIIQPSGLAILSLAGVVKVPYRYYDVFGAMYVWRDRTYNFYITRQYQIPN